MKTLITILTSVGILILIVGISWIATCGIVKIIALCFGMAFSWAIATGIWLVIILIKFIFSKKE